MSQPPEAQADADTEADSMDGAIANTIAEARLAAGPLLAISGAAQSQRALLLLWGSVLLVIGGLLWLARGSLTQPLRFLERRLVSMARGELQRPVTLAAAAPAEVARLFQSVEEVRRALLTRLRSSTELNLQLESEVARRTVELSRRNHELSEALAELQKTRAELVRREKLAAVGRVAARVTTEIVTPVSSLVALPDPIAEALVDLESALAQLDEVDRSAAADAAATAARLAALSRARESLTEMQEMLAIVLRGALRAGEIVRAMRVYARPSDQAGTEARLSSGASLDVGVGAGLPDGDQAPGGAVRDTAATDAVIQGWLREQGARQSGTPR